MKTAEQLAALQNLACDSAQGFYFAKPMPRIEARAVLQNCAEDNKAIRLTDC